MRVDANYPHNGLLTCGHRMRKANCAVLEACAEDGIWGIPVVDVEALD